MNLPINLAGNDAEEMETRTQQIIILYVVFKIRILKKVLFMTINVVTNIIIKIGYWECLLALFASQRSRLRFAVKKITVIARGVIKVSFLFLFLLFFSQERKLTLTLTTSNAYRDDNVGCDLPSPVLPRPFRLY